MTENNSTQFKTEGDPAFEVENTETDSTDSSSETKDTDQTGSSDQDKNQTQDKTGSEDNFADHPRWKEREGDWKQRFNDQEQRHADDLAKVREEFDERLKTFAPQTKPATEIPGWFGGDEESWKQYQEYENQRLQNAKDEAVAAFRSKEAAEQKLIDDATKYFEDELVKIESDKELNPDGTKVDRNKLLKTAMDFKLVDTEGRWNYRAAAQFMKFQKTSPQAKNLAEKKQVASATTSENRGETKQSNAMSSQDFKNPMNRPW